MIDLTRKWYTSDANEHRAVLKVLDYTETFPSGRTPFKLKLLGEGTLVTLTSVTQDSVDVLS